MPCTSGAAQVALQFYHSIQAALLREAPDCRALGGNPPTRAGAHQPRYLARQSSRSCSWSSPPPGLSSGDSGGGNAGPW